MKSSRIAICLKKLLSGRSFWFIVVSMDTRQKELTDGEQEIRKAIFLIAPAIKNIAFDVKGRTGEVVTENFSLKLKEKEVPAPVLDLIEIGFS